MSTLGKLLLVLSALTLPALPLAAGPAAAAAPRPPVAVGTFEPSGGATLAANLAAYTSTAGHAPDVVNYFTDWAPKPFPAANLAVIAQTGAIPLVSWQPQQFGRLGPTTADPAHSLAAIAAGADDAYILDWARAAKAYGGPLYLRLAHEMNGNWYAWGRGVLGNTPELYVAMWQHVHDLFAQVGATNVRWVWCPNVTYTAGSDPQPYYPGSDYVDVVGLDGYNRGAEATPAAWLSFASIFDPTMDSLSAYAADKPVWIVETGSTEAGGDKAAWIRDMFATVASDTRIGGLLYFDEVGTGNWPLSTSAAAGQAYADGWAALRAAETAQSATSTAPTTTASPAPTTAPTSTAPPAAPAPTTAPTTAPSAPTTTATSAPTTTAPSAPTPSGASAPQAAPTLRAAQLAAHTRHSRTVRLSGRARPGASVVVQRRVGARWRTIKAVKAGRRGRYAVRASLPRETKVVVRAHTGTSAYRRVTVRVR